MVQQIFNGFELSDRWYGLFRHQVEKIPGKWRLFEIENVSIAFRVADIKFIQIDSCGVFLVGKLNVDP